MIRDRKLHLDGQYVGGLLDQLSNNAAPSALKLPDNTALALHLHVAREAKGALIQELGAAGSDLLSHLEGEMALILMADRFASERSKIWAAKVDDTEAALSLISKKAFKGVKALNGYYRVDNAQLPSQTMGDIWQGFERCYVTSIGEYIIFGDHLTSLKLFVSTQELDGANAAFAEWGKGGMSVAMDTERAWSILYEGASEPVRASMEQNRRILLNLKESSLSFGGSDMGSAWAWEWINSSSSILSTTPRPLLLAKSSAPITTRPYFFHNKYSGRNSLMVQDTGFHIKLFSPSGGQQWSVKASGPITTQVNFIEQGSKGTGYALFATQGRVYQLDPLGRLANLPFEISSRQPIEHIAVASLGGKENSAVLASAGYEMIGFSRSEELLLDWTNIPLPAKPVSAARSFVSGGQAYILWVFENGLVWLLDERGENYPGFPINLKLETSNAPIVENSRESTRIKILSESGEMITIGLKGDVVDRKQIFQPHGDHHIRLIMDEAEGDDWIISEQDRLKLWIYDKNGEQLFTKEYLNPLTKEVQFFNFGNHAELISVTEKAVKKTHLYFIDGTAVFERPLASTQLISAGFDRQLALFTVYKVRHNQIEIVRFAP